MTGNPRLPAIGWNVNLSGEHIPLGDEGGSYTGWARRPAVSDDAAYRNTLLAMCCMPWLWPFVPAVAVGLMMKRRGV